MTIDAIEEMIYQRLRRDSEVCRKARLYLSNADTTMGLFLLVKLQDTANRIGRDVLREIGEMN